MKKITIYFVEHVFIKRKNGIHSGKRDEVPEMRDFFSNRPNYLMVVGQSNSN